MDRSTIALGESIAARGPRWRGLWRPKNLGAELESFRGVGPGFDFLRMGLALIIFYGHTALVLGRTSSIAGAHGFDAGAVEASAGMADVLPQLFMILKTRGYVLFVPMFFALSGFLVSGSAVRVRKVTRFLSFRLLRIFPALCVEVTLSALILGAIFTTLPLGQYFTDPQFFRYFGNIVGHVTFTLPGVFTSNPHSDTVNGALWTLPPEFFCYLILSGLMLAGILWRREILLAIFAGLAAFYIPASLFFGIGITDTFFSTPAVVSYFLAGVLMYVYRDKIPLHPALALGCGLIALGCVPFASAAFLMVPFLAYFTIWIGMQPFLALPFMKGRDYSYGIYLYNYPIAQAIVASVPGISRGQLIVSGLFLTVSFAVFSWHYIEKPFLKLKR